ncbi:unnamed protein product [Closterium sp. Naga37s-1]|nr:unnamed protein product [Closterium sp. Naga37s-1]
MSGSVPFETALAARLEIFNPSAADVAGFLRDHPPSLPFFGSLPFSPFMPPPLPLPAPVPLLASLPFPLLPPCPPSPAPPCPRSPAPGSLSRYLPQPVAALLDIPVTNIFANRLLFEEGSGAYAGFDANEPTSRSGGKARAIAQLKQEHGFKSLVMVGDGATDLEARQPGGADMFIGYGGIQVRKVVAAESDWFAMDFQDLIDNV